MRYAILAIVFLIPLAAVAQDVQGPPPEADAAAATAPAPVPSPAPDAAAPPAAPLDAKASPPAPAAGEATLVFAIRDALKSGNWRMAFGLLILTLLAFAKRVGLERLIPPNKSKWVALGMAFLGAVGAGAIAGLAWDDILLSGVGVGLAAIGLWEVTGAPAKKLKQARASLPPQEPAPPSEPQPPPG